MPKITIRRLFLLSAIGFIASILFVTGINWFVGEKLRSSQVNQERLINASTEFLNMRYQVVQIQQFLTDVGATHNPAGFKEAQQHRDEALRIADELETQVPEYGQQLEQLRQGIQNLYNSGDVMARAYMQEGIEAGNEIMQREGTGFDAMSASLSENLEGMSINLTDQTAIAREELGYEVVLSQWVSVGFSFVILLIGLLSYVFTYTKILPPLDRLKQSLTELMEGDGDLTKRLPVRSGDEVGTIVDSFNDFIHMLHNLIKHVALSSMPLTLSAKELAEVSEKARNGAIEQETETHKVASAVDEMSAAISEVARHATNTMEETKHSTEKASDGQRVVNTAIEAINGLAAEVTRSADVIKRLENHSNDIDTILATIKGIAEQTNLLALNAAIEAARAGEQGRGFAVVADEVRSLAVRTQESTAEIQGMVEQLQQAADEAVVVMNASHEKAQESVEKAAEAGDALREITSSVSNIADMSAQIATASEEQSSVAEEINRNIISIDDVTKKSVGLANETSESANNLVSLSEELSDLVKKFRV